MQKVLRSLGTGSRKVASVQSTISKQEFRASEPGSHWCVGAVPAQLTGQPCFPGQVLFLDIPQVRNPTAAGHNIQYQEVWSCDDCGNVEEGTRNLRGV